MPQPNESTLSSPFIGNQLPNNINHLATIRPTPGKKARKEEEKNYCRHLHLLLKYFMYIHLYSNVTYLIHPSNSLYCLFVCFVYNIIKITSIICPHDDDDDVIIEKKIIQPFSFSFI